MLIPSWEMKQICLISVFNHVENQAQLVWTCAYEEKDDVWKSVWAHFIVIRVVVECVWAHFIVILVVVER